MRKLLAVILILSAHSAWALEAIPTTVTTQNGTQQLTLETALTPRDREYGLMNRTSLPDHGGMLFVFPRVTPISFWMKNTKIALDMLFVDESGMIVTIGANETPESLTPIPSGKPIKSVIEIAGGKAAQWHIQPGDQVAYTLPESAHVE